MLEEKNDRNNNKTVSVCVVERAFYVRVRKLFWVRGHWVRTRG